MKRALTTLLILTLFLSSCRSVGDDTERQSTDTETSPQSSESVTKESEPDETDIATEIPLTAQPLASHAEKWLDATDDPERIIMTLEEIEAENKRMSDASDTIADLGEYPSTITGAELNSLIYSLGEPILPKYTTGGEPISESRYAAVLDRRGVYPENGIYQTAMAIVTERADMRMIPDDAPYYSAPNDPYDTVQLTEIAALEAVIVLHASADGDYVLVQAYNYLGWIRSDRIAVTEDAVLWKSFSDPQSFVTVISQSANVGETVCDMGVRLPLINREDGSYTVMVPKRDAGGALTHAEALIDASDAVRGALPYTYANFIAQAFKYEGTDYSWGGREKGVDCSGYIANVMKSFGFRLPRDTGEQCEIVGTHEDFRGFGHDTIAERLRATSSPTAVYYPGHTLFYLGYDSSDGSYVFIHAPQIGEQVRLEKKFNLSGMTYICEIGRDAEPESA